MEQSASTVWARISNLAGKRFTTKTGKPFTYTVTNDALVTDRTDYLLGRRNFETALAHVPCGGPGEINQTVRGPSYVWAILHDARVRRSDW